MKKLLALLLALAMVFALCACGQTAAPAAAPAEESAEAPAEEAAAPEEPVYSYIAPEGSVPAEKASSSPIKIKVTTTHKPGAASYEMEQFMLEELTEKDTEGWFELELYDSGTLYKTDAELPAILGHEVAMSFIQPSFFYDNGLEWANMLDMGYLFDSVEHLEATFDPAGEIGGYLQQALWDEFHVMTFGCEFIGTRNLWLHDYKEINTPDDVKGLTIRMPTSASYVQLGNALGFNVTPLDITEIYLAMETGLIDGHENQAPSTYSQGQFEVTSTLVFLEHMIAPNFVTLDGDVWDKMTAEQQDLFYTCMRNAIAKTNAYVKDYEQELFKVAEDEYGMKLQYPDKEAFKAQVQAYYLDNPDYSGKWDLDLLQKINELGESMK